MFRTPLLVLTIAWGFGLSGSIEAVSLTDLANVKREGKQVEFAGNIVGSDDISGVTVVGKFLVIVSDEAKDPTVVQVLKKQGAGYRAFRNVELPVEGEADLEAVAADRNVVYVTGSCLDAQD